MKIYANRSKVVANILKDKEATIKLIKALNSNEENPAFTVKNIKYTVRKGAQND